MRARVHVRAAAAVAVAALLPVVLAGCGRAPTTLVAAFPRGLVSTDPFDPGHDAVSTSILRNVYEPLVEPGEDLAPRPGLAESWHSPDELTWVFRLRHGVRLHDGHELTPQDVVRSVEASMREPWTRGELAFVSEIRARGDDEVEFRTRQRFDALPMRLSYVFVAGETAGGRPAPGSGPYRIASWEPGGHTVLEAVDGYRDGTPQVSRVEIVPVAEGRERAQLLRDGQVQIAVDVPPKEMAALRRQPGITLLGRPGLGVVFLAFDVARETSEYVVGGRNPFHDPRVREALDLGLDRRELVADGLAGYGEAVDQLPLPGEVGFEAGRTIPASDPERARRLLAAAGFPRGFGVTLHAMRGQAEDVVELLRKQWARLGVRLEACFEEAPAFLRRVEARDTALYMMRWRNDTASALETYASLLHTPVGDLGPTNGGGFSDPELDRLIDAASRTPSAGERVDLLRQATARVLAARPILPLFREHDLLAFRDTLQVQAEERGGIRFATVRLRR